MSITTKTADLKAEEIKKISFGRKYPYLYVKNLSDNEIYVSEKEIFSSYADNVTTIPAHSTGLIYRNSELQDVYILAVATGKAEILGAYDANLSFNYPNSIEGGGSYDDTEIKNDIADLQNSKVDKLSNKGLSTNDYTTEEKEKLAALENYDDTMIKSDIANKVENDIFVAENLIPFPFYFTDGYNYRGITYNSTVDGGVTITGTPTGTTYARLNKEKLIMLEHKKYVLSGCPNGGSDTTYCLGVTKGSTSVTAVVKDYGNGAIIDNTDGSFDEGINITVAVYGGTYDNFEFKPMLEVGSIAHAYQPYLLSRKAMRDDIDAILALEV